MRRDYWLEVVAKWEGTHGFGYVNLRPPTVDGHVSVDLGRPWWVDRTEQGSPVTIDLEPDDFDEVKVGSLFRVTIEQMTTVGEEINRRRAPTTGYPPLTTPAGCICSAGGAPPEEHATSCPVNFTRGT